MIEPAPHPIPIVVGGPGPNEPVQVTLRVLERGHGDYTAWHILGGTKWAEELEHLLEFMLREARQVVGVRHGTWICHVHPLDRYTFNPSAPPPVARELRNRNPREWRRIAGYEDTPAWAVGPAELERYGLPY